MRSGTIASTIKLQKPINVEGLLTSVYEAAAEDGGDVVFEKASKNGNLRYSIGRKSSNNHVDVIVQVFDGEWTALIDPEKAHDELRVMNWNFEGSKNPDTKAIVDNVERFKKSLVKYLTRK